MIPKFRGKRKDNGEWVVGVPIPNSFCNVVYMIPILLTDKVAYPPERLHEYLIEIVPETLGQSTGLKDKNGMEIYCGDIVSVRNHPFQKKGKSDAGIEIDGDYAISWNEGDLTWCAGNLLLARLKPYVAVAANIWENPELLDQANES